MAVWSKTPLTASYLYPLSGFEFQPGYVRKFPVTSGQLVVFACTPVFLPSYN